ncbi:MAG TPA: MFS transporter [Steroidobacteraceae bacterium]|nr:MFS transporter [Steroidobacteraceae bacterium]
MPGTLSTGATAPATRARYVVMAFMVTLAMVTYLDRACIGAMAPKIAEEFALDEAQMSWVFFAFILAYAIFEIPTARWADARGAKSVLTRIVSWWSVFTIATAGAFNYYSLLATRFLFGAGEAGAWPCVARVMSRWIPKKTRGTAKGLFFAGAYASAAVAAFIVPVLLTHMTWRSILVTFGGVGFVWVIAWQRWFRNEPTEHPAANEAERALIIADRPAEAPHPHGWPFWRQLLRQRNVLLLCVAYMPNCATFYFCITWLPTYLMKRHGFEKAELGFVSMLPLGLSILTQFLGGFFSDEIAKRYGLGAGRRTPGIAGYLLAAVCICSAAVATAPVTAAVLIAFAAATCMLTTATSWSTCVDIGREHSATVSATMNTSGQIAAMASAPVVGYSVKWLGDWNMPFWLLGGLFVVGATCWAFIDPKKPVFGAAALRAQSAA